MSCCRRAIPLVWALTACAGPASSVPRFGPDTSLEERSNIYSLYKLKEEAPGYVRRQDDVIGIRRFKTHVWACDEAARLIEPSVTKPWFFTGLGLFVAGIGGATLLSSGNGQTSTVPSNTTAFTLVGIGAGVSALSATVGLLLQPDPAPSQAFATAYNRCLRQTLGLTSRRAAIDEHTKPGCEPSCRQQSALSDAQLLFRVRTSP